MRILFHLDMDAFYASVEQRDNPALRGRPVIVGGSPDRRGVVCAASYEARRFGVHSAMPSSTAGRLCPKGVFIRPRMSHYRDESRRIMEMILEPGAVVEQMSVDEAYLDVTATVCSPGPDIVDQDDALYAAVPLAKKIRARIATERNLTASIGIASNKLLAKLGSDFSKPNGLTLIPDRDRVAFLRPLPVSTIHGVGKMTAQVLHKAGLHTIADVQDYPGDLRALLGSFGPRLKEFAFGRDDRPLALGDDIKSVSSENTFERNTDERPVLRACLRAQADEIAQKLHRKHLAALTVQVKVRYGDFTTLTRQISVEDPVTESSDIYRLACHLLARDRLVSKPLRLIGVGVSHLSETRNRQLMLFPNEHATRPAN